MRIVCIVQTEHSKTTRIENTGNASEYWNSMKLMSWLNQDLTFLYLFIYFYSVVPISFPWQADACQETPCFTFCLGFSRTWGTCHRDWTMCFSQLLQCSNLGRQNRRISIEHAINTINIYINIQQKSYNGSIIYHVSCIPWISNEHPTYPTGPADSLHLCTWSWRCSISMAKNQSHMPWALLCTAAKRLQRSKYRVKVWEIWKICRNGVKIDINSMAQP